MHDVYIGIDHHMNLAREQLHYFCEIMKSEVIFLSSTSDLDFFFFSCPLWFSKRLNCGEIMQCWVQWSFRGFLQIGFHSISVSQLKPSLSLCLSSLGHNLIISSRFPWVLLLVFWFMPRPRNTHVNVYLNIYASHEICFLNKPQALT